MSSAFERGISQKSAPSTGDELAKYSPPTGGVHLPLIKFCSCSISPSLRLLPFIWLVRQRLIGRRHRQFRGREYRAPLLARHNFPELGSIGQKASLDGLLEGRSIVDILVTSKLIFFWCFVSIPFLPLIAKLLNSQTEVLLEVSQLLRLCSLLGFKCT